MEHAQERIALSRLCTLTKDHFKATVPQLLPLCWTLSQRGYCCAAERIKQTLHNEGSLLLQGREGFAVRSLLSPSCCLSFGLRYCTLLTRRCKKMSGGRTIDCKGANALTTPPTPQSPPSCGPDENVWRAGCGPRAASWWSLMLTGGSAGMAMGRQPCHPKNSLATKVPNVFSVAPDNSPPII